MNGDQKTQLRECLSKLAMKIVSKFGKVSTAFRAFDLRTRGFVVYSDFAYVIDSLKLNF